MIRNDNVNMDNEIEKEEMIAGAQISCNCYFACCGGCNHMDVRDANEIGEGYCRFQKKYYPFVDRTCSHFEQR